MSSSSCLRYKLNPLDMEMIKSPSSTTSWISNSSSPSSTLSESSNCPPPLISTRKPRTPRKRPNQTYNEAAAILSTAYPKIFPANKQQPCNFTKSLLESRSKNINNVPLMPFDPSDLLIHNSSGFLLHTQRSSFEEPRGKSYLFEKLTCQSPGEINSDQLVCGGGGGGGDDDQLGELDFDAESIILDEEIGAGIDCIMGDLSMDQNDETAIQGNDNINNNNHNAVMQINNKKFCYGYPVGLGFDQFGEFGIKREMRAFRNNGDEGDWWRFPSVNVVDVTPRLEKNKKKKKKKKMVEIKNLEPKKENSEVCAATSKGNETRPLLKLNYKGVLDAWSDKASPFSGDHSLPELAGNDVHARLAQIDLFSENGGIREASVQRYKEKRRNRLFSKKIRYQVRKLNADRRPRMKGRFVRTPNTSDN